MKLTEAQLWFLSWCLPSGVLGLAPGSNMWPLVEMSDETGCCYGEEVDELLRAGLITAAPRPNGPVFIESGGGEIPDLEATHLIVPTEAGRLALQQTERGNG